MQQLNIPQLTAELRDEFQAKAYAYLDAIDVAEERKQPLRDLAEGLLARMK